MRNTQRPSIRPPLGKLNIYAKLGLHPNEAVFIFALIRVYL